MVSNIWIAQVTYPTSRRWKTKHLTREYGEYVLPHCLLYRGYQRGWSSHDRWIYLWGQGGKCARRYQGIIYETHYHKRKIMEISIEKHLDWLDPKRIRQNIKNGIRKWILILEWTAKKETPVDTWFLRNAYRSRFSWLSWELVNTSEYGIFIHEWRKPWKAPPLDHIETWRKRKGIEAPAFLIARKIAQRGTKPNPFLTRTVDIEENNIISLIKSELKK